MVQVITEQEMKQVNNQINAESAPAYDSDRVAQILARSQRAVDGCQNAINHVEQTQERLIEVHQGIQEVNQSIAKFAAAGAKFCQAAAPLIQQMQAQGFGS